jgi:pseudaminic acid synthase
MKIASKDIGPGYKPYIIAEISANHRGYVSEATNLIQAAADSGADAVKIQCYTADSITFKGDGDDFVVKGGEWGGKTLYDLYKSAETPPNMVRELFAFAKKQKITLFSSVFDFEGVKLMKGLGAPAIKIASFELVDLPLIEMATKTGIPMIISTGMGDRSEIMDAINTYYRLSLKPDHLALLHCVSSYPADPSEANLPELGPLSSLLGGRHVVGFSDHTLGIGTSVAAVSFGAALIEKHFTLDRAAGGPDAHFSLEPTEFSALVVAAREAWQAIQPCPVPQKSPYRLYRKSLFVVKDVACGDSFSTENCRAIRPASGLPPKLYASVLGSVATRDLKAGTPLTREMVSALC